MEIISINFTEGEVEGTTATIEVEEEEAQVTSPLTLTLFSSLLSNRINPTLQRPAQGQIDQFVKFVVNLDILQLISTTGWIMLIRESIHLPN